MVQEKGAAQSRKNDLTDFLRKSAEEYDRSIVKTTWAVWEHTPGYNTGGYYDQDIPAENHLVSPWFDTKEEAVAWRDRHEPDKGNCLLIGHSDLTEKLVRRWNGPFLERTPK